MPKVSPVQNNFTAGEISPWLYGRFDIAKYSNAAKTLENVLIHQAGGGQRRPGTKYVAAIKTATAKTRLITFEFSTTQAYIIELGNLYARFYRNNGQIDTTTMAITAATKANPCVVTMVNHPFANGDLITITGVAGMTQLNGNTYTVANRTEFTVELSGTDSSAYGVYTSGGTATRTGVCEIITPYTTAQLFDLQFAQDADTMWIVHPSHKPQKLTRADHTSWLIGNYTPELMTLDVAPGGDWSVGETIRGTTSGATCIITEVLTTKTYNIRDRVGTFTLDEIMTNETDAANQGAAHPTFTLDPFTSANNYPSCVAMFEQRIWFANTNTAPQQIWGSVSGNFDNMTVGANADDAFVYVIASDKVNAIRWLKPSSKSLQMGTLGGTFSMSSGSDALAITPTNVSVKRDTTYGSANILPETIGNFIYYVGRDLNHMRELGFSFDIEAQQALDMTILADHIAKAADPLDDDGLTQIAYQQSPVSRLWCVRNDGQMAVLTRQIDQEVIGWSRQVSGSDSLGSGEYESVAIIPTDGGDDEVWVIVKRYVSGAIVRYVEYFMPERFDHQQDAFFVDSGLSLDSPKTITAISAKGIIDDMEYATDPVAQAAYVSSNGVGGEPGSWDVLDEPCNDFTTVATWVDGDGGNAVSEISPAGQFHMDAVTAGAGTAAKRVVASVGAFPATMTLEIKVYHDVLGTRGNADHFELLLENGTEKIAFTWSANKMEVYGSDAYNEAGTDEVSIGVDQIWRFLITWGGTCDVYLNGNLVEANVPCDRAFVGTDGEVDIRQRGTTVAGETHIDYIKIYNGLIAPVAKLQCYSEDTIKQQGSYSLKTVALITESLNETLTRTIVLPIDLSGLDSIKLDVIASRTGSNFKIGFHDDGGVTTEHTVNIAVADVWQTETIDISGVINANKNAIDSIIITILDADADNVLYVDNIYSPADYITVTATDHGFVDDDEVRIVDVIGMTELNNRNFVIEKLTDDTFALLDSLGSYIDGSTYTLYISGGEARKMVTAITGLTHLAGEEVAIFADGAAVTGKIVSSVGGITLDAKASMAHIGLPYISDIVLLPYPEGSATGTAVGKVQRTYKLIIKLYGSLSFQFGPDADNLDTLEETELFTGDKIVEFHGDWDRESEALLRQSQPLPLNILSVTRISEVVDD